MLKIKFCAIINKRLFLKASWPQILEQGVPELRGKSLVTFSREPGLRTSQQGLACTSEAAICLIGEQQFSGVAETEVIKVIYM